MPLIFASVIVDATVLFLVLISVVLLALPSRLTLGRMLRAMVNEHPIRRETVMVLAVIATTHTTANFTGVFAEMPDGHFMTLIGLALTPLLSLPLVLAPILVSRHMPRRRRAYEIRDSVMGDRRAFKTVGALTTLIVSAVLTSILGPWRIGSPSLGSYLDFNALIGPIGAIVAFALMYWAHQRLRPVSNDPSFPVRVFAWCVLIAAAAIGVISIVNISAARELEDFSGMGFWAGTMWRSFVYLLLLLLYSRGVLLRRLVLLFTDSGDAGGRPGNMVVPTLLLTMLLSQGIALGVLFF